MDPTIPPAEAPPATEIPHPRGLRRAGLFFLAFASGFAVLTIEIAGARLIAPVFGLSAVPWTAVIGVILAALALGSHLGGRWASGRHVPLSAVLVAAGFTGALPILGASVPWYALRGLGFVGGAVASALVLFAPSVLCLGAVVPYLVQADTESLGSVGRRAGDVSAAATAGSILGSFATGFLLLPAMPVTVLLGLTAAGLLVLAWLSGWVLGRKAPGELLVLGAVGLGALGVAGSRPGPDTLFETQTLYASVQVTEQEGEGGRMVRTLRQNGGPSSAEYVDTGDPAHVYVSASAQILEPAIGNIRSMLVLGGAALSLPVAFERRSPAMRIDVVEIDPVVTGVAREYFAYGRGNYPNIRVVHDDARVHLRKTRERWDLIYLDVFDHLLTVPWTMVTVEALSEMEDHLEPHGLFVANVLSPVSGPGAGFLQSFRSTLARVYPEVRVYLTDAKASPQAIQNLIVVASRDPQALPDIAWPQATAAPAGRPLTDMWAPVEYLQAKLFVGGVRWN